MRTFSTWLEKLIYFRCMPIHTSSEYIMIMSYVQSKVRNKHVCIQLINLINQNHPCKLISIDFSLFWVYEARTSNNNSKSSYVVKFSTTSWIFEGLSFIKSAHIVDFHHLVLIKAENPRAHEIYQHSNMLIMPKSII